MIWIALPIALLLLFISKKGRVVMSLKDKIKQANQRGGWKGEEIPTEFGKFFGVYPENIPRTVMSLPEFANIVKQTIGTNTHDKRLIIQSIIAIAIREQGALSGLKFPDNNPFGFNAFKGKWQYIRDLRRWYLPCKGSQRLGMVSAFPLPSTFNQSYGARITKKGIPYNTIA